jgi:hypothetical protein
MARKTAIRRLFKRCPVSTEAQLAVSLDEMADAGVDQRLEGQLDWMAADQAGRPYADEVVGLIEGKALDRLKALWRELSLSEEECIAQAQREGAASPEELSEEAARRLEERNRIELEDQRLRRQEAHAG